MVVIPMYNEEAGAARCVDEVCAALDRLPAACRLVVVEDGSRDRTPGILQQLSGRYARLSVVSHGGNRGYGAALQTGVRTASAMGVDYVLFMDSDLTNSPRDIPRFADAMKTGAGVIKATRYSLGGRVEGVPAYRVIISAAGNRVARWLMRVPIHDCTNGFRAVRVALLSRMTLHESRFPIIMEELAWCRALGATFTEVPVTLSNRAADQRPTTFSYRPQTFWRYLKYPLKTFFGWSPVHQPPGSTDQSGDRS